MTWRRELRWFDKKESQMSHQKFNLCTPTVVGAVAWILASPGTVFAAGGAGGAGQALPWEGPLNQVLASFTGPVAKALCILAIVVLGFGFAFSEGGGLRPIRGLVRGGGIAARGA